MKRYEPVGGLDVDDLSRTITTQQGQLSMLIRMGLPGRLNLHANLRAWKSNRRGNATERVTDVIPPDMLSAAGAQGDILTLGLLKARGTWILVRVLRQVIGRCGGSSGTSETDEYRHTESDPHPSLHVQPTTHT